MAAPLEHGPHDEHILLLLATAEADIRADRLADAAATYKFLLTQAALESHPSARSEACANYGALLLHQVRSQAGASDMDQTLDRAISLLSEAQRDYGGKTGDRARVITETNLALAYFQRHVFTGNDGDLMAAHMALDAAEARTLSQDRDILDWIDSVRATLVQHAEKGRAKR